MISWKKNTPSILETKIVKRFAWFPVLIEDEYYWLGFYYQKYRYEDGGYYNTFGGAFEGQTHADGKTPFIFDAPQQWGDYMYGSQWVEKERALTIDGIPIYEVDNFNK